MVTEKWTTPGLFLDSVISLSKQVVYKMGPDRMFI